MTLIQRDLRRKFPIFVLPALVIYSVFVVVPAIAAVVLSFTSWNGMGTPTGIGFKNYVSLLHDSAFLTSFRNTIYILVIVGVAVFAVSFLIIALIRDMRGRSFVRAVIFFPIIISAVVIGIVWGFVFDYQGIVNDILQAVHLGPVSFLSTSHIFTVMIVGLIWTNVGLYTTIILAATDQIPKSFYDDAKVSGANRFQLFRHVTLPMSWDVVSLAAVLWTINSLKLFEFMIAFGGSPQNLPPVQVWNSAVFVYAETFGGQVPALRLGYASASAVVYLVVFGVIVVVLRRLTRRDALEVTG